jgi:galactitol-specific phosphotransferase system IIB component
MNVEQILTRLNITPNSRLIAVQEVRERVETASDPIAAAKEIVDNLTIGETWSTDDPIVARMTAAFLVDNAIKLGDNYDPTAMLQKAAEKIAYYRETNPWFFYKREFSTVETTTETRHNVAVEVKADGKLKKGGKQIIAQALFENNKTMSTQDLVKLFMKELDMSKAGATTYVYNCKKAAGMTSAKRGGNASEK